MANARDRLSHTLSYILRHKPDSVGISLDPGGWVDIDELIERSAAAGEVFDRQALLDVVNASDKQRFTVDASGTKVRAAQGHSVPVDLGLVACAPPEVLYHGTASRFLESIMATGLEVRSRQHVHLSPDTVTALSVGKRHGSPAILRVDAAALAAAGHSFWQADNGVWLTTPIPPQYLQVVKDEA